MYAHVFLSLYIPTYIERENKDVVVGEVESEKPVFTTN